MYVLPCFRIPLSPPYFQPVTDYEITPKSLVIREGYGMKTAVPRGLPLESETGLLTERNSYLLP